MAFLISIITVYIERINVLKTDRRAKLSISYKIEGKSKVKASFNGAEKEIEVPRIRMYENSGTIKSTYMLTPYVKENNLNIDTIDSGYFSFNAVHIHLNENTNFLNQMIYIMRITYFLNHLFQITQMKTNLILSFVYSRE